MDKLLVEVIVPALETSYDVCVPSDAPMSEVSELIQQAVSNLSDGRFVPSPDTVLCRQSDGSIININAQIFELDIHNGSKLMLI